MPPSSSTRAATPHRLTGRLRFPATIAAVLLVLAGVNVLEKFGPRYTGLILGPAVAVILVVFARRSGLTWDCLGLSRRALGKGLGYAAAAIAVVATGYLIGAALPLTRTAFLDARY